MQASPKHSGAASRLNIGVEELETFLAIAELGSFSKAAERLFLAQPSISNRVQRLERAVSARLFERTTRAVVLTPAGERLRLRVEPIINDLHAVLDEFRTEGESRKRVVAVATTAMLAAMLLPQVIQRFTKANPAIRIELHDDVTPQLASDIRTQRIDFAVMARGAAFDGISFESMVSSKFMVVGPRGHPALTSGAITAKQLSRYPFLALAAYHKKLEALTAALDGGEFTLAAVGSVSNVSTLLGFVAAGLGLTVLPSIVLSVGGIIDDTRFDIAHLRDVSLIREYGIASLTGQEWSPAAKAFAAALRADFQAKSSLEDVAAD